MFTSSTLDYYYKRRRPAFHVKVVSDEEMKGIFDFPSKMVTKEAFTKCKLERNFNEKSTCGGLCFSSNTFFKKNKKL